MDIRDENAGKALRCSFCGKTNDQVKRIIIGPDDVCICDECINTCAHLLDDDKNLSQEALDVLPTPEEITEHLSQYVVEQDQAKNFGSCSI